MPAHKSIFHLIALNLLTLMCAAAVSYAQKNGPELLPTVEEHRIAEFNKAAPRMGLRYLGPEDSAARAKRWYWRKQEEPGCPRDLKGWNAVLNKAGYHLRAADEKNFPNTWLTLMRDTRVIIDSLQRPHSIEFDSLRSSFLFVAERKKSAINQYYVYVHDRVTAPYELGASGVVAPKFFRGSVLTTTVIERGDSGNNRYAINLDNKTIYSFSAVYKYIDPLRYLFVLDTSWVLEYGDRIVINGTDINDRYGYDECFTCRPLHNRLFYFFKKNGKYYLKYGTSILPCEYDRVFYGGCCEDGGLDPMSNQHMVWFFASRNGYWYYVETGFYD